MQYVDFDLELRPGSEQDYPLSARSPEGEVQATLHFPFEAVRLENYLLKVRQALHPGGPPHRRVPPQQEQPVREFGQGLFEALFAAQVGELYRVNLREAERRGQGVRLR